MRKSLIALQILKNVVAVWADQDLQSCGSAFYHPDEYICYDGGFLCPTLADGSTQRCGEACYSPSKYICSGGSLHSLSSPSNTNRVPAIPGNNPPACPSTSPPSVQYLLDPPYSNYFLSTCHVAANAVVTSPLASSNLTLISPRLVVAFPGGNSGVAAFWKPRSGRNGSLGISIVEQAGSSNLSEVYIPQESYAGKSGLPAVGVSGVMYFNSSAVLTVPILGSVRTIRDFTEGPSLLVPEIQDAIRFNKTSDGGVTLQRTWLDNVTTTTLGFVPVDADSALEVNNGTVMFESGSYMFWTAYDFPQLSQLSSSQVLNSQNQDFIRQQPETVTSLSFLSYTEKLLAGTWRFLTYFGRDSMIAALLLQPVLSEGPGSATEAVIGAVLERINRTDGSVSHEETLGDYATYLNMQMNITSTEPMYTYQMIDTDYYLPIIMERYFLQSQGGHGRAASLLGTQAGSTNPANKNLTWGDLAFRNAQKLMTIAARFAANGNRTIDNLAHLKADQMVGEWRDSTYGIGGGRIPYDVNTGLMPAALQSIAALAESGVYPGFSNWSKLASQYAAIWEDETLGFFKVTVPADKAKERVKAYVQRSSFPGPDQTSLIDSDVVFHALSLQGNDNLTQVQVMNTDDCFRLFFLNGTSNQTQHTSFLNQSANNVMRTFPAGLLSDVGLLVANPAYGEQPVYAENFTNSAYHGTVVWSWQQAMMAKGFERQLLRCGSETPAPDFCKDQGVHGNLLNAYNKLWDVIEANQDHLSEEMWSWRYDDGFKFVELGDLPPPAGVNPTESDIRQLWSLTFLAVGRNSNLKPS